tara:strand:+ start:441 stop:608 length:168 start_codon:yes stop_codon:yes gene_type:complete
MDQVLHFYKAFWKKTAASVSGKNQKQEPDAAVFSKRLFKNGELDPCDEKKSFRQK